MTPPPRARRRGGGGRARAFQSCTVGYSVDEHATGRGIATTMVRSALPHAFGPLRLHRVEAGTLVHNGASRRVLENCGFQPIGISRRHLRIAGEWQDHRIYSITVEDWHDERHDR